MALEVATYISGLNANNPVGATDPKSQGDEHLRLVKSTLLNTFPGITGAVLSTHVELNLLDGITGFTGSGTTLVKPESPTFTGTMVAAAINATSVSGSGASLTALNATQLASGTVPDARFPATLPAASGANLTALNATQLTTGTVPDARIAAASVTQHQASLSIAETQIADGALLARVAANETISGTYTYSARPQFSAQGGFLANASSSNTGGRITLSSSAPADAADVGSPGDMRFVYV